MKILAVIPARSGSCGIPNKNIRLIGGHPLVYYAICNAIQSSYITDIIVSTDSPEVKVVAEQMGVTCHWRRKELCADSVTLDAVIADAIPPNAGYDYIITMQPTSPTLKSCTLDRAILHAIENGLDTLISAINTPHLSWRVSDGGVVPNYTERLNRQYLPPHYMETGAFLISKASVVTSSSRIGPKVEVFEIPSDESYDIDTFEDLLCAKAALNPQKIAIYVNGNHEQGIGHIYRALEIADELMGKPDIYYDVNQTDKRIFGNTMHNLKPVNGLDELFSCCKREQYTIFINDISGTSIDYMAGLRSILPDAKIVNFEDGGEGAIKADLVFNALYRYAKLPQVKAGAQYFIANKMFMLYRPIPIKEQVKKVFICFGGSDPQNYSDRLLSIISQKSYKNYEFVVALGRAKCNVDQLMEYNMFPNITVLYDVVNMPELMTSCDVGITSRGRTGYELAMLGIPTIAMAQNKREEEHGVICNENGFSYIGLNPPDEVIETTIKMYFEMSQESRQRFQDMLLQHDLRNGRGRVMSLIQNL